MKPAGGGWLEGTPKQAGGGDRRIDGKSQLTDRLPIASIVVARPRELPQAARCALQSGRRATLIYSGIVCRLPHSAVITRGTVFLPFIQSEARVHLRCL
jgi:hypothetical protein